jgi:hypothetical protein
MVLTGGSCSTGETANGARNRIAHRGLTGVLLDHLVGGGQQRLWNGEAKRLGGLEVDGKLDFCGLLDRQIGWFLAFENVLQ